MDSVEMKCKKMVTKFWYSLPSLVLPGYSHTLEIQGIVSQILSAHGRL